MVYFLFCRVFLISFSLLLWQKCRHRHRRDVATFAADISAYPRETLFATPPSALRTYFRTGLKKNPTPPLSTGSTPSSSWPNWPRRQFPGWVAGSLTLSRVAISALFLHLEKEGAGDAEFVITLYAIAISAMKLDLFAKQRYLPMAAARVQGYEENKSLRAVSVMYQLALCFCC